MVINLSTELCTIVKRELIWLEQFAKTYELSRRASAASACQTEEAQKEITNASEAFTYLLHVDIGNGISLERIPALDSDVSVINSIIEETNFLMRGFINEIIQNTLVDSEEFKEAVKQQLAPQIAEEFKEVFQ